MTPWESRGLDYNSEATGAAGYGGAARPRARGGVPGLDISAAERRGAGAGRGGRLLRDPGFPARAARRCPCPGAAAAGTPSLRPGTATWPRRRAEAGGWGAAGLPPLRAAGGRWEGPGPAGGSLAEPPRPAASSRSCLRAPVGPGSQPASEAVA